VFDVPAGSPSSAHDEVDASPCDPRAGPPNELLRSLRSWTVAVAQALGSGRVAECVPAVAELDVVPRCVRSRTTAGDVEGRIRVGPFAEKLASVFAQQLVNRVRCRGQRAPSEAEGSAVIQGRTGLLSGPGGLWV
jgi:hypothetical protein